MNCLKNVVIWYEDHRHRCPYEPHLAELDPTFGLYTTAVWQCEAGHRYFQDLHSPLKPLSDSDPDSDKGGSEGLGWAPGSIPGTGKAGAPASEWEPGPGSWAALFCPSGAARRPPASRGTRAGGWGQAGPGWGLGDLARWLEGGAGAGSQPCGLFRPPPPLCSLDFSLSLCWGPGPSLPPSYHLSARFSFSLPILCALSLSLSLIPPHVAHLFCYILSLLFPAFSLPPPSLSLSP